MENGIKAFSFQYRKGWTGGTARSYKVDITNNGSTVTYEIPSFGAGGTAQDDVYTWIYSGLELTGTVVIKIYNAGAASTANQATFDNFEWTDNPKA